MKIRCLLFSSMVALGLTINSHAATSLTGLAYTAKLAWAPNNYSATFTGVVGSGYEVSIPGYGLDLDPDNFGRLYSVNQGQFYGSDIFTVEVTFADLEAQQFSVPSDVPFQYNSRYGVARLATTAKNQLTFSYWGDFTSQYAGVYWGNWWGYGLETNPDYVPETSSFALLGVAAIGLIGMRKRFDKA
jgi:hypothetical protein